MLADQLKILQRASPSAAEVRRYPSGLLQTARPAVRIGDGPHAGVYRSPAIGRNGVVASAHGQAATAGLRALRDGGTANRGSDLSANADAGLGGERCRASCGLSCDERLALIRLAGFIPVTAVHTGVPEDVSRPHRTTAPPEHRQQDCLPGNNPATRAARSNDAAVTPPNGCTRCVRSSAE